MREKVLERRSKEERLKGDMRGKRFKIDLGRGAEKETYG